MAMPGRPAAAPDHEAFWAWWSSEGADACAAAIADGTIAEMVDDLTTRIHAVSADLAWELGPGERARHVLLVSPEGNPDARAVARRWLRAAPPASATWEYADSRRASPDPGSGVLRVGDDEVDFASIRVGVSRVGNHVDVAVHHPLLRTLPEQARGSVLFLSLDHALGETACETWVGAVDAALEEPPGALTLEQVRELVDVVRADATGDDGEPVWVLLRGDKDGEPIMAAAQVPLAPSWAPHLDAHLAVRVPFVGAADEGMPTPEVLDELRALEDHLSEQLAGSGRLVAHETQRGLRTLHYYVESTLPTLAVVEAAVGGWTAGRVEVTSTPDPSWHGVRHLRT